MKLTDFIIDIGRPIAYYPGLKAMTKSITASILLCQLIYWTGKQADADGWIFKTSTELEEETGLSYDEQKTARNQLLKLGFIEEKYRRLDHQLSFKIVIDAINQEWRNRHHGIGETGEDLFGNMATPDSLIGIIDYNIDIKSSQSDDLPIAKSTDAKVKKAKQPKTTTPREVLEPIVMAIAQVTGDDPKINYPMMAREAKQLHNGGYTADQILAVYSPGGAWYKRDWRGKKGQRPDTMQIRKEIAKLIAPLVESKPPEVGNKPAVITLQPAKKMKSDF